MKKLFKFSLFALAGILFTATASDAQMSYRKILIKFDNVQNNAGIPGKSAQLLNTQIQRSLMELNRMEVMSGTIPAVSKKPGKGKRATVIKKPTAKPAPGKRANTIAQVIITSFTTRAAGNTETAPGSIDKGGPFGENSFMIEGQKAVIRGKVEFRDATTRKVVDSRDFRGQYLALPKEGQAFNKAALLKKAIDKAVKNFRADVKYLFQGEHVIKEILEGKNGDALNVLISAGATKDIKVGYKYVAYTKKSAGRGKAKKDIIGTITILNVKDNEAMAKVGDGKSAIFKKMKGEGNVYVELK